MSKPEQSKKDLATIKKHMVDIDDRVIYAVADQRQSEIVESALRNLFENNADCYIRNIVITGKTT